MSFVGSFVQPDEIAEAKHVSWGLWSAAALVGAEVLIVYNGILTAQAFFDGAFPGLGFAFSSMIAYSLPMCVTQFYLIFKSDSYSLSGRMRFGFGGVFLSLVLLILTVILADVKQKNIWYGSCLAMIVLMSVTSAVMQSALMGFCAKVSAQLSVAAMFGFGASGLITFGVSELCIALGVSLQVLTTILFAVCLVFTVLTFFVCERVLLRGDARNALLSESNANEASQASQIGKLKANVPAEIETPVSTKTVLWQILPHAVNVFIVFATSLSMFPGVCVEWKVATGSGIGQASFTTLIIGMFQVFDVIGRYSAGPVARFISPKFVLVLVLMRLAFIPLFMMGQRSPDTFWLWGSAVGRCILMAIFAATNGFIGSLAMMFGPGFVAKDNRGTAGTAMSCFMVSGIFAGTLLAPLSQIRVGKV